MQFSLIFQKFFLCVFQVFLVHFFIIFSPTLFFLLLLNQNFIKKFFKNKEKEGPDQNLKKSCKIKFSEVPRRFYEDLKFYNKNYMYICG